MFLHITFCLYRGEFSAVHTLGLGVVGGVSVSVCTESWGVAVSDLTSVYKRIGIGSL